jgi:CDP-diacylglycerol--glycerol-3-phosphate 3-phosphatidyltransferase
MLLAYFGFVPWWAVVLILIREIGLTVYRLVVVNRVVIAANSGGKIKTILQSIVIPLMLSPVLQWSAWIQIFAQLLFWVTAVITVYTGVQYVVAAARSPK